MSVSTPTMIANTREQLLTEELTVRGRRVGADAGEALVSTRVIYQHPDRDHPKIGVWACTVGAWDVADHPVTEAALLLSGRARLTDSSGDVREFGPGDLMVLPTGWSGRWEILEDVKKYFVLSS